MTAKSLGGSHILSSRLDVLHRYSVGFCLGFTNYPWQHFYCFCSLSVTGFVFFPFNPSGFTALFVMERLHGNGLKASLNVFYVSTKKSLRVRYSETYKFWMNESIDFLPLIIQFLYADTLRKLEMKIYRWKKKCQSSW